VLDRLVAMFKASDKNGYVRQPVVTYLTVASEQSGDVGTRARTALAELEQLDPEGVRQARSLMAFGALGRARPSNGGVAATTEAAASTTVDASASTTDEASEFAATSEGTQAAREAEPGDFPDPADYSEEASPQVSSDSTAVEPAGDASESVAPATEAASTAQDTAADPQAGPPVSTETASPSADVAPPAGSELNTLLVVGVPLGAAMLLMGVYWIILRIGAI
jgi:hypothetical protein